MRDLKVHMPWCCLERAVRQRVRRFLQNETKPKRREVSTVQQRCKRPPRSADNFCQDEPNNEKY
jgi:hypothetical protein